MIKYIFLKIDLQIYILIFNKFITVVNGFTITDLIFLNLQEIFKKFNIRLIFFLILFFLLYNNFKSLIYSEIFIVRYFRLNNYYINNFNYFSIPSNRKYINWEKKSRIYYI